MKNPDKPIFTDLYHDAGNGMLLGTICAPIITPKTGEFYGAICADVYMVQGFLNVENSERTGPTIYNTPTILQLDNELSTKHLG